MVTLPDWIATDGASLLRIAGSAVCVYVAVIVFTRFSGLRTFSKLSSFDFAITIALGSVFASILLAPQPSLLEGVFAMGLLLALQYLISRLRLARPFQTLVDNEPLLVLAHGRPLHAHMRVGRITQDDLNARLRQAGLASPAQALAIVLETTGELSVIRTGQPFDPAIMANVRGADAHFPPSPATPHTA